MTAYDITATREERLIVWLAFRDFTVARKRGRLAVSIVRRGKPVWLYLQGDMFQGLRVSHRSAQLEKVMAEFLEAERALDRGLPKDVRERIKAETDPDVVGMCDFYTNQDLSLEQVRRVVDKLEYRGGRVRTKQEVRYSSLWVLVQSLMLRRAYQLEVAAREQEFNQALLAVESPASLQ